MDINEDILRLEELTGVEVSQDIYDGSNEKYIVFAYEDEHPNFWGDDEAISDTADIQVNLYTPKNYNYMELKTMIRDHLETLGEVTSIRSYLEKQNVSGSGNLESLIRHTVFSVSITKGR